MATKDEKGLKKSVKAEGKGAAKTSKSKLPAGIVLVGPTGSGKTPLGEYLEKYGFIGRRCLHFDFGHHLRMVVSGQEPTPMLTQKDVEFIVGALESGALLEDEQFHIAERILKNYLSFHTATQDDFVILNGLPRHEGQARDIARLVNVRAVIMLECTPAAVLERIDSNIEGDRKSRMDDTIGAITHRLKVFVQRTMPLMDYYEKLGARIVRVTVGATSKSDELSRKAAADLKDDFPAPGKAAKESAKAKKEKK